MCKCLKVVPVAVIFILSGWEEGVPETWPLIASTPTPVSALFTSGELHWPTVLGWCSEWLLQHHTDDTWMMHQLHYNDKWISYTLSWQLHIDSNDKWASHRWCAENMAHMVVIVVLWWCHSNEALLWGWMTGCVNFSVASGCKIIDFPDIYGTSVW